MEAEAILAWIIAPVTGGVVLWNAWLSKQLLDIRITIAREYHSKGDIDAIIDRAMVAVGKQIKAEMAPLRFRLGEISRALKIPPELHQDDIE
jgi:hypothetical protein